MVYQKKLWRNNRGNKIALDDTDIFPQNRYSTKVSCFLFTAKQHMFLTALKKRGRTELTGFEHT